MKVTTERQEDHQVKLTLVLDSQELERAKRRVAREYARRLKFPGFRPGKAPYELVVRRVGEETIQADAIDQLLDKYYPEALETADIDPSAPGKLERVVTTDPPTFELLVPLRPEVDLGDYRSLRLPFEPPTVDDEMVTQAIDAYRQMFSVIEPVDRPAEVGDMVYLDVKVYEKGQEEGEPLLAEPERPVLIEEEDDPNEWPFPGFARSFLGAQAGESKVFEHTFGEDVEDEALRGKTVVIKAEVVDVKARQEPELDDEFAQQLGFENVEALRKAVREQLEREALGQYETEFYNQAIQQLMAQAELKYPPHMVDEVLETLLKEEREKAEQRGLSWEAYLAEQGVDEEGMMARLREQAEDLVRRRLILEELARQEHVEVPSEEVNERVRGQLINLLGQVDKRDARRLVKDKAFINELIVATWRDALLQAAIERLIAIAKGEVALEEAKAEEDGEEAAAETDSAEETAAEEAGSASEPPAEFADDAPAEAPDVEAADSQDDEA